MHRKELLEVKNSEIKDNIKRLVDEFQKVRRPESEKIGWKRISAIYGGKESDYIPILVDTPAHFINYAVDYNLREQFFSKEKMLYATLKRMIGAAKIDCDGQLCLRANLGTVLIPSLFGIHPTVIEHNQPWCKEHLSKEEILHFRIPEDLSQVGLMPKALDYMAYFQEIVGDLAHVYLPDTDGPFEIAHLVYGDNIFTEIYDDPRFIHRLLGLTTKMFIRATQVLKEALGEPRDSGYHGHGMSYGIYMSKGGTRISDDTPVLLSPKHIKEFVTLYDGEISASFSGGWIHYCGYNISLTEEFMKMNEIRGINLGNPEKWDPKEFMKMILDHGKFYFGSWKRNDNEPLTSYFRRIIDYLDGRRKGLIFLLEPANTVQIGEVEHAASLWREIQDEELG